MSKASEWIERYRTRPMFASAPQSAVLTATVKTDGDLEVTSYGDTVTVPYTQALALARWILDTFGDEAPS